MKKYLPEGIIFESRQNKRCAESFSSLRDCLLEGRILEARAYLCDREHNLHFKLGKFDAVMMREECAVGISDRSVRDIAIISRVNKPSAFKIIDFSQDEEGNKTALLSRRAVQEECIEEYIKKLSPGDIIDARVTHNEKFGSFCDIGCGVSALLPIDSISVSRIPHPDARFPVNTMIKAVVKSVDENGRVTLSHKELLGTWEENAQNFKPGQTVGGIVRSVEKYGVFIELAPNLAGLAECTPSVREGDCAGVYIKSINPEKMKIKLAVVDSFPDGCPPEPVTYYFDGMHLDYWRYSPECSEKIIESVF